MFLIFELIIILAKIALLFHLFFGLLSLVFMRVLSFSYLVNLET